MNVVWVYGDKPKYRALQECKAKSTISNGTPNPYFYKVWECSESINDFGVKSIIGTPNTVFGLSLTRYKTVKEFYYSSIISIAHL